MKPTIFDQIVSGEIPTEFVYEDDHVVAFNDINPQAPVHVLVLPKRRMASLAEAPESDPESLGLLLRGVARTARTLGLEENGYRVVFNTGRDALQSVAYVHAHILAGRTLQWPPG